MIRKFVIAGILFIFGLFGVTTVLADDMVLQTENSSIHIHLDIPTIAKGHTVATADNALKLYLAPRIFSEETAVDIEEVPFMDMPWRLDRVSPVFQFEFSNKAAYDAARPFQIQIRTVTTTTATKNLKQMFFYDKNYSAWKPLPTWSASDGSYVRALIHLPFARIAVFSYPDILAVGDATWYKHKNGNYAASPDFPKGSKIRVHNLSNKKFVNVTINDYGPDRSVFPKRVVDLDKRAFAKIASLKKGVIPVRVEVLDIPATKDPVLGIPAEGIGLAPSVYSKAAIVIDEGSGSVLFEKNADEVLPIASLSKLVAVRVFLDTHPALDAEVVYSVKDEKLNYQYVDHPSEAARLKVKDGETMTVKDLIYASLVGSANNTIETLVRVSGMTRSEFIEKMNSSAVEWGATATHFDDPTGLSPKNVSSPRDFARLALEAFRQPVIQQASIQKKYSFSTLNTKKKHTLTNTNKLIGLSGFEITGSKTGYLHEAGYCLVTRIQTASGGLIAVAFGDATKNKNFSQVAKLLSFGKQKQKEHDLAATQTTPPTISIRDGELVGGGS